MYIQYLAISVANVVISGYSVANVVISCHSVANVVISGHSVANVVISGQSVANVVISGHSVANVPHSLSFLPKLPGNILRGEVACQHTFTRNDLHILHWRKCGLCVLYFLKNVA